jgi:hypothetical protein
LLFFLTENDMCSAFTLRRAEVLLRPRAPDACRFSPGMVESETVFHIIACQLGAEEAACSTDPVSRRSQFADSET